MSESPATTPPTSRGAALTASRGLSELFPDRLPRVVLRTATGHPIVYQKRIASVQGNPRAGDLVAAFAEDELLGYGIYNPRAEIALRLMRWGDAPLDEAFWTQSLISAVSLRRDLLKLDEDTNAYRVVHAEGDGLSGLVADRYGDVLSIEAFSWGVYLRSQAIAERLGAILGTKHVRLRPQPHLLAQEGHDGPDWVSPECPSQVTVNEFGTRFRVRFADGHKTGFFCDQRDNRRKLAAFCRDKTVLDLCCYTGGFAVQAKRLGQAREVTAVDLDEGPIALAKENANLNQVRVHFAQSDAFAYLRDLIRLGRRFDVVVLDPPKLITNRREYEEGSHKHFDLNRLAFQIVQPGGVLLTCSCAGLLSDEDFSRIVMSAAKAAARDQNKPGGFPLKAQLFDRTGAASDHPIAANCPEAAYLKAFWLRIS